MTQITQDEQARLMSAAKTVADKATLIMEEIGNGDFARAAEFARTLENTDLAVLRRKISEAGEKTDWGLSA